MPIWQRMMFSTAANLPSTNIVAFGDNNSPFIAVYKNAAMTKLSAPATLPSTVVHCTAINRVNAHVAASLESVSNTNNLLIYDTSGSQLVLLKTISVPGAPTKSGLAYSPDGKWLAVTSSSSPYLFVYDVQNNYALISSSVIMPSRSAGNTVAWVNGRIVVGWMNSASPVVSMISIDARPGWTYVSDITLPSAQPVNKLHTSRDGKKMAILGGSSVLMYWSDIDVSTYTFGTGRTLSVIGMDGLHFSFDGQRLGISLAGTPFISQVNSSSLTTWTALSAPASLPAARPFGVVADPNETGFVLGGSTSGVLLRYNFSNVKGTNIAGGPGFCYYGSSEKVN